MQTISLRCLAMSSVSKILQSYIPNFENEIDFLLALKSDNFHIVCRLRFLSALMHMGMKFKVSDNTEETVKHYMSRKEEVFVVYHEKIETYLRDVVCCIYLPYDKIIWRNLGITPIGFQDCDQELLEQAQDRMTTGILQKGWQVLDHMTTGKNDKIFSLVDDQKKIILQFCYTEEDFAMTNRILQLTEDEYKFRKAVSAFHNYHLIPFIPIDVLKPLLLEYADHCSVSTRHIIHDGKVNVFEFCGVPPINLL